MPSTLDVDNYDIDTLREKKVAKRLVVLTSVIFLCLLLWQTYSASRIHQQYQESLMSAVTENIHSDFSFYFKQLREDINSFQNKHLSAIAILEQSASLAKESDFQGIYQDLIATIDHSELFTIIGKNGENILAPLVGESSADCQKEIQSVITNQKQHFIFMHHNAKDKVHFDIVQPLLTSATNKKYFSVSFKPVILKKLLEKYQLPHQQLFLIQADKFGKIELSSIVGNKTTKTQTTHVEISSLSYIRAIAGTQWQLAIKLDEQYNQRIYLLGFGKALIIWLFISLIIYSFYRIQISRLQRQNILKQALVFKDNHDALTGLSNRVNFDKKLTVLIKQQTLFTGVAFHIDIDQFQVINNTYGFAIGDRYLYQLSLLLSDVLPDDVVISRLANDEFAVLLPQLKHQDAVDYANSLRKDIKQITLVELPQETRITASIGVVILDDHQVETQQVLAALNQSVHIAKKKGRNRVQLYQSNDKQLIKHANEMDAIHELSDALKEDRLVLFRQRIKPLITKGNEESAENTHYEVLVRMKMPDGTLNAPHYFIGAAEKYGLIKQLDRWVIENTFKAMATTTDEYSINLSGLTLADSDTGDFVKSMFKKYNINPKRICFEITETSAISHLESALIFIKQMNDLGCIFSLDDFGSGLSSFSYLQKLPVHIIKIDGAFVRDIDSNKVNRIFVENMQRTAIAMNKKIVAEFIETEQIENILKDIGIHYGQGYFIHKPEPWFQVS